jgi:hypothetical protein
VDIVLPSVGDTTGWIALDACLAGPDVAAADATFAAIVASVAIARGGASS